MKILYFDVETTGITPGKHAVIQFAFIIEINGEVLESGKMDIAPHKGDLINPTAMDINGILVKDMLKFDAPELAHNKILNIFDKYIDRFDQKDKFTPVAYNGHFDIEFMSSFFEKCGDKYFGSYINWNLVDPLALVRYLRYKGAIGLKDYKLETVCNHFGIKIKAHNALSDVEATKALLDKLSSLLILSQ